MESAAGLRVVTADRSALPIQKGLSGPRLLAHVITEKYADHIPLNRQEHRLAWRGVELSRLTLCDWMDSAARTLEPLYEGTPTSRSGPRRASGHVALCQVGRHSIRRGCLPESQHAVHS
jgi:transposase